MAHICCALNTSTHTTNSHVIIHTHRHWNTPPAALVSVQFMLFCSQHKMKIFHLFIWEFCGFLWHKLMYVALISWNDEAQHINSLLRHKLQQLHKVLWYSYLLPVSLVRQHLLYDCNTIVCKYTAFPPMWDHADITVEFKLWTPRWSLTDTSASFWYKFLERVSPSVCSEGEEWTKSLSTNVVLSSRHTKVLKFQGPYSVHVTTGIQTG